MSDVGQIISIGGGGFGGNPHHTSIEKYTLFKKLDYPRFYFLHSYYFTTKNPTQILATTNYNGNFTSAVKKGKIFGVQFHPEKSHGWGIQLLQNFAEL